VCGCVCVCVCVGVGVCVCVCVCVCVPAVLTRRWKREGAVQLCLSFTLDMQGVIKKCCCEEAHVIARHTA
jgi:hypothetical protein